MNFVEFISIVACWLHLLSLNVSAEYFELDANAADFVSDTQEFGCTGDRCNVTRTWRITGVCDDLFLSVDFVKTDVRGGLSFKVIVNNGKTGFFCGSLDDCTYDWFHCEEGFINPLDITNETFFSLENPSSSSEVDLSITLAAFQIGTRCPFGVGMDTYYDLYGRVTLFCVAENATWTPTSMPTVEIDTEAPSSEPTMSTLEPTAVQIIPNEAEDDSVVLDTQTLLCDPDEAVCSISWHIDGSCDEILLTLSVYESSFAYSNQRADIFLNGQSLGECEGLDSECTGEWKMCTNISDYDISSYLNTTTEDGNTDIALQVVATPYVEWCGLFIDGNEYVLYAQASLACVNGNASYTPAPIGVFDYILLTVDNAVTSVTTEFGCESEGCGATSSIKINGFCDEVTLSLSMVETDFADNSGIDEYIWVYVLNPIYYDYFDMQGVAGEMDYDKYTYVDSYDISGVSEFLGYCEDLNEDCTNDWVKCNDIDNIDISDVLDLTSDENVFFLYIGSSSDVNYCPYEKDGESFYVYGGATITCFQANATRIPTSYPTVSPSEVTREPTEATSRPSDTTDLAEVSETSANTDATIETTESDADGAFGCEQGVYLCVLVLHVTYAAKYLFLFSNY